MNGSLKRLRDNWKNKHREIQQPIVELEIDKPKEKKKITSKEFWELVGATSHYEFETALRDMLLKREEREAFYRRLLEIDCDVSVDSFKPYFEIYSAERKTNQQDYTPESVAKILSIITRQGQDTGKADFTAYDMTAGTGTLLINKWWDDILQETPWSYAPHRYFYLAEEMADNAIPYLIHNLALRGMNAVIVHGDSLHRKAKQVYFLQNSKDDFLAFSDVNVLPHTETVMKLIDIREWTQDPIEHIESGEVVFHYALPSKAQRTLVSQEPPKFKALLPWRDAPRLKEVAFVERAKKGKIYPEGSIVIQISATRGQFGRLESDGQVGSQYAVVTPHFWMGEGFDKYLFFWLHLIIPHWFHMRQEGLNISIKDIEDMPLSSALSPELVPIEYGQQKLF